jgi:hypothetical protein
MVIDDLSKARGIPAKASFDDRRFVHATAASLFTNNTTERIKTLAPDDYPSQG